jgi:hypothetical protein
MDKKLDKFIRKIREEIDVLYSGDVLFSDSSLYDHIDNACEKYLEQRGCIVQRFAVTQHVEVQNISDLVNYFYGKFIFYHPKALMYKIDAVDRSVAADLVQSIKDNNNFNNRQAFDYCVELINILFEEEEKFNFNLPIINFTIFAQGGPCAWITEAAVKLLNKRLERRQEELNDALANEFIENRYTGQKGWSDEELDSALKKIEGV